MKAQNPNSAENSGIEKPKTLSKNPSPKKEKFNWVTVAVSLGFAVTLWFIVALNNGNYSTWFTVPVQLINFPERYQIEKNLPTQIRVEAEGHGIDLLLASFGRRKDTVKIDFLGFSEKRKFIAKENLDILTEGLPPGLKAISAFPSILELGYQEKSSRRVPVVSMLNIELPETWRISGDLIFTPDSVYVTGPEGQIETLIDWPTSRTAIHSSAEDNSFIVKLEDIPPFKPGNKEVQVSFRALSFTEGKTKIPVRVMNVPMGITLRLIPDSIEVKYLVPADNYELTFEKPLSAWVDYSQIKKGMTTILFPEVRLPSNEVEIISIEPNGLDYLLIREK